MPIITIDTETRGLDCTKFVLGSIYDGKVHESFTDRKKMANRILQIIKFNARIGKKTRVYAHNMEYDFYTVFQNMWRDFKYVSYPNPFIAVYETKGQVYNKETGVNVGTVKPFGNFHSTTDIFPMSLAMMAKAIGTRKMEIPEKLLGSNEKLGWDELCKIREYCENDARIVYESLERLSNMIEREFGSKPRRMITAGQIAMSAYMSWVRKNYPDEEADRTYWESIAEWNKEEKKWQIPKTKHDSYIRVGYRGGNNTAFQTGRFENVTMIDVNSLYPYIMATMRYPDLKREEFVENPPMGLLEHIGMSRARVRIEDGRDLLPIRYLGRMMIPHKRGLVMESIWTNWELQKAMKNGYIIEKLRSTVCYPDLDINPFTEYVGKLYKMKQEPDKKEISKVLLNALSGKFGQKRYKKKLKFIHRREVLSYARQGWTISGEMGEYYAISKLEDASDSYFVNPVIIANITAGARLFLYNKMKEVKGRDLLYCDTDSMIVRDFDLYESKFEIGNEMGQWKKEFDGESIYIKGEKKYASDSVIKMSGAGRRFVTRDNFERGRITQQKMVGLEEAIRGKTSPGIFRDETMIIQNTSKKDIEIPGSVVMDL